MFINIKSGGERGYWFWWCRIALIDRLIDVCCFCNSARTREDHVMLRRVAALLSFSIQLVAVVGLVLLLRCKTEQRKTVVANLVEGPCLQGYSKILEN